MSEIYHLSEASSELAPTPDDTEGAGEWQGGRVGETETAAK